MGNSPSASRGGPAPQQPAAQPQPQPQPHRSAGASSATAPGGAGGSAADARAQLQATLASNMAKAEEKKKLIAALELQGEALRQAAVAKRDAFQAHPPGTAAYNAGLETAKSAMAAYKAKGAELEKARTYLAAIEDFVAQQRTMLDNEDMVQLMALNRAAMKQMNERISAFDIEGVRSDLEEIADDQREVARALSEPLFGSGKRAGEVSAAELDAEFAALGVAGFAPQLAVAQPPAQALQPQHQQPAAAERQREADEFASLDGSGARAGPAVVQANRDELEALAAL
jgi:hypothetical protein